MGRSPIFDQRDPAPNIRLLTVDIFDTLLRRHPICERRRHMTAAHMAANESGFAGIRVIDIFRARRIAQKMAYLEIENSGRKGDVRLDDVFRMQLALLGLADEQLAALAAAEIRMEIESVQANADVIDFIERYRRAGIEIVGLSDTAMSREALLKVIAAHCGQHILDRLYTSADLQATKRSGEAFDVVMRAEAMAPFQILHVGDDDVADVKSAQKRGIEALHVPQNLSHRVVRMTDAARFECGQRIVWSGRVPQFKDAPQSERISSGAMLGPIVAEFCMRLWLYLASIPDRDRAVVLFCARGGLSMKVAFEEFCARTGLPVPVRCVNFMVSRLIAVRGAFLAGEPAACEELTREFSGATHADAARALTGKEISFDRIWEAPFDAQQFLKLLDMTAVGSEVKQILTEQAELLGEHLADCTAGASRIVLCDTGLYGSTMRMLQTAYSEYAWECILFARRNYKGFPDPHFARTTGLSVQADAYNPFDPRTSVLRYWQLIESLFEPELPSCKTFTRQDGGRRPISNLDLSTWIRDPEVHCRPQFQETLRYLRSLDRRRWFSQITAECDEAWRILRSEITFPNSSSVSALAIRKPTRDLGRTEDNDQSVPHPRGICGIRSAHWREGYAAEQYPRGGRILQMGIELLFAAKFIVAEVARRVPAPLSVAMRRRTNGAVAANVASAKQETLVR